MWRLAGMAARGLGLRSDAWPSTVGKDNRVTGQIGGTGCLQLNAAKDIHGTAKDWSRIRVGFRNWAFGQQPGIR